MKDDPRLRPLTPAQAKNSLAARLAKTVDKARQIEVRLGMRPYQVFMVWTTWEGDERGDGNQRIVARIPMTPTPKVSDLTALRQNAFSAGRALVGDLRLTEVSANYPLEVLMGNIIPDRGEDEMPHPYHFFYEVVEDGRHCPPGEGDERKRFSLEAAPFLDAENQQWILTLGKMSGDMQRDGTPRNEPAKPIENPWRTRKLEAPPGDDDF